MPSYAVMACLYKKANWLWPFLIRHRLTAAAWRPFIEAARLRHLRFRKRLRAATEAPVAFGAPLYGGV